MTTACEEKFEGPPEIMPVELVLDENSGSAVLKPILDDDTVQLVRPIQGGYVMFIGALGTNLSVKNGSLLGELRRKQAPDGSPLAAPGGVLVSDERSVRFEVPSVPGGQQSSPADPNEVANLPTCPNPLEVDIVDNPLFLVLTYKDAQGRSASATRSIVPRCTQADGEVRSNCICQCLAGYTTNRCFRPADAGVNTD